MVQSSLDFHRFRVQVRWILTLNLCSSGIFYHYLYLMSRLGAGGSPTNAGLTSTPSSGSSGSNKSGSSSAAWSPHAGNSMVFALLLALISGSLAIY